MLLLCYFDRFSDYFFLLYLSSLADPLAVIMPCKFTLFFLNESCGTLNGWRLIDGLALAF